MQAAAESWGVGRVARTHTGCEHVLAADSGYLVGMSK